MPGIRCFLFVVSFSSVVLICAGCGSDRIYDLFAERGAFQGRFTGTESGDYVWLVFKSDGGAKETFAIDEPTLKCFLDGRQGELMKVSFLKTERYSEYGGGYFPANIITEIETEDTTFTAWVEKTSPDWRECLDKL